MVAGKVLVQKVRPVLSRDHHEARLRALTLYRAWYRNIPFIVHYYRLLKTETQVKEKIRTEFYKNSNLTDIRLIDMIIAKSQMELKETIEQWKQECHVYSFWRDTVEPKPKDFLSKFVAGSD